MLPELFDLTIPGLGRVAVTSYGVMMVAAFLAGNWVMRRRLGELERDPRLADDVMLAALVGGLVGAKLHYVVVRSIAEGADPAALLFSRAGLVWYGGLIGGAAAVIWLSRRRGVPVPFTADLVAPALALGYGLGRVGCFLVGDDYGRPTESWIGIAFPEGSPPTTAGSLRRNYGADLPADVPDAEVLAVIPTQLFEAAAGLLVFAILWRLRDHRHRAGWLFSVWLVLAGVERFLVEIVRIKDDRFLGPLSVAQALSVGLVVVGGWLWWRLRADAGVVDPGRAAATAGAADDGPRTPDA
ncbi:MAG: prolipoprotein diacylglyceryl transferase [Gemmatimonadota bacterium]